MLVKARWSASQVMCIPQSSEEREEREGGQQVHTPASHSQVCGTANMVCVVYSGSGKEEEGREGGRRERQRAVTHK